MKRLQIFIGLFCIVGLLYSQNSTTFQIDGRVVNEHNEPIAYANVFLEKAKRGTITNKAGYFRLLSNKTSDVLSVSHLGYKTFSTSLKDKSSIKLIRLQPASVELKEVIVSNLTAKELLEKAISKIPENYSQEEFMAKMFYRATMSTSKDSLEYVEETELNEIKSYKKSFEDKTFLVKNRNFHLNNRKNAIEGLVNLDYVKFFLERKNTPINSNLSYGIRTSYDNTSLYVIELNKDNEEEDIPKGKIYINVDDLAFVRFELQKGHTIHTFQYKKIGSKYFLISGTAENRDYKLTDDFHKVSGQFVVTEIVQPVKEEDVTGVYVKKRPRLNDYATQNNDTAFWSKHNQILPDSLIQKQILAYQRKKRNSDILSLLQQDNLRSFKSVYEPHLSLNLSSDTPNDIYTFAQNSLSLNSAINYYFPQKMNQITGMLMSGVINYFILNPLEELEVERKILSANGLRGKIYPIEFNHWDKSYFYGITPQQLNELKQNNYFDFMRLHNVRNEYHHIKTKLIEEEIAKADMSKRGNLFDYLLVYSGSLLLNRLNNVSFSSIKKDIKDKNSDKTPMIIDANKSWVKYLFQPDFAFNPHIKSHLLTSEEEKYLKRTRYLSWMNLVSPQLFGLKKFSISDNLKFTFSLNYLRIPFGEQIEQNLWFSYKKQLNGLFFRQYINHEKTGFGIGYKLYDVALTDNMNLTSTVDYWLQPKNLRFYDKTLTSGFHIGQNLEWKILVDKYSKQNKLSLFVGYDFKTKGYQAESLYTDKHFKVNAGIRLNF